MLGMPVGSGWRRERRGRGDEHQEAEGERAQRPSHGVAGYPTGLTARAHGNVIVTSRRPQATAPASVGTHTSMRSPTIAEPVSAARQLP